MQPFEKTPDAVTGRRISAVDYAKTFAILCVVVIHVSSEVLLGRQIGSAAWLEGLFWSSLARGAVPMFLMCSGVLFMDRSGGLSVRHIWNRNIPHILIALFVWAAVYKVIPRFLHEKLTAEALHTILLELLCGQHEGHLYFLHIMLLVYAALPVTYTFAANADDKTERYALSFWILYGVLLPTLKKSRASQAFSGIFLQWPLTLAWGAIGCTWLGHFLIKRKPLPVHLTAAMILIGFIICFAGTWPRSIRTGKLSAQLLEGLSPGPCFLAAGFFSLCIRIGKKENRKNGTYSKGVIQRLVLCVSGASAGSACAGPCWLFNQLLPPSHFGSVPCAAVPLRQLLHLFAFKKDPVGQPLDDLTCIAFAGAAESAKKQERNGILSCSKLRLILPG